jgi:hypothetical protein
MRVPSQSVRTAGAALESLHPITTKYHHEDGERKENMCTRLLARDIGCLETAERSGVISFTSVRLQCYQQPAILTAWVIQAAAKR